MPPHNAATFPRPALLVALLDVVVAALVAVAAAVEGLRPPTTTTTAAAARSHTRAALQAQFITFLSY